MADVSGVTRRSVNRTASQCAAAAFGLAAFPALLIAAVLLCAGVSWARLLGPTALVLGLLVWPLTARTNKALVIAEVMSGGVLFTACLLVGILILPLFGLFVLLPFLPAVIASLAAIIAAIGDLLRETNQSTAHHA